MEDIPCKKQIKQYFDPLINFDENDPTNHEKLENLTLKVIERKTYYFPLQQKILLKGLKYLTNLVYIKSE